MEYIHRHMQGIWPLINLIDKYRTTLPLWHFTMDSRSDYEDICVAAISPVEALKTFMQCEYHFSVTKYLKYWTKKPGFQVGQWTLKAMQDPQFPWTELCQWLLRNRKLEPVFIQLYRDLP